jgi:hypothetical protein
VALFGLVLAHTSVCRVCSFLWSSAGVSGSHVFGVSCALYTLEITVPHQAAVCCQLTTDWEVLLWYIVLYNNSISCQLWCAQKCSSLLTAACHP